MKDHAIYYGVWIDGQRNGGWEQRYLYSRTAWNVGQEIAKGGRYQVRSEVWTCEGDASRIVQMTTSWSGK